MSELDNSNLRLGSIDTLNELRLLHAITGDPIIDVLVKRTMDQVREDLENAGTSVLELAQVYAQELAPVMDTAVLTTQLARHDQEHGRNLAKEVVGDLALAGAMVKIMFIDTFRTELPGDITSALTEMPWPRLSQIAANNSLQTQPFLPKTSLITDKKDSYSEANEALLVLSAQSYAPELEAAAQIAEDEPAEESTDQEEEPLDSADADTSQEIDPEDDNKANELSSPKAEEPPEDSPQEPATLPSGDYQPVDDTALNEETGAPEDADSSDLPEDQSEDQIPAIDTVKFAMVDAKKILDASFMNPEIFNHVVVVAQNTVISIRPESVYALVAFKSHQDTWFRQSDYNKGPVMQMIVKQRGLRTDPTIVFSGARRQLVTQIKLLGLPTSILHNGKKGINASRYMLKDSHSILSFYVPNEQMHLLNDSSANKNDRDDSSDEIKSPPIDTQDFVANTATNPKLSEHTLLKASESAAMADTTTTDDTTNDIAATSNGEVTSVSSTEDTETLETFEQARARIFEGQDDAKHLVDHLLSMPSGMHKSEYSQFPEKARLEAEDGIKKLRDAGHITADIFEDSGYIKIQAN